MKVVIVLQDPPILLKKQEVTSPVSYHGLTKSKIKILEMDIQGNTQKQGKLK